jgi:hypothetical protein
LKKITRDGGQLRQVRLRNNPPSPVSNANRFFASPVQFETCPLAPPGSGQGPVGFQTGPFPAGFQTQPASCSRLCNSVSGPLSESGRFETRPSPPSSKADHRWRRGRSRTRPVEFQTFTRSAFKPGSPTRPPSAAASPGRGRTGPVRNSTPVSNPTETRCPVGQVHNTADSPPPQPGFKLHRGRSRLPNPPAQFRTRPFNPNRPRSKPTRLCQKKRPPGSGPYVGKTTAPRIPMWSPTMVLTERHSG